MGICISKSNVYPSTQEEKETNMIINKQIQEEAKIKEKNDNSTYKVLLLGPADSGKSTFLKQLRIINKMPLEEDDCKCKVLLHVKFAFFNEINLPKFK